MGLTNGHSLLGVGIYTVREAARLTRVSAPRIHRLLRGYTWQLQPGIRKQSPPVIAGQLHVNGGQLELGFLDMIETMAVNGFLAARVPWRDVRLAHKAAQELLKVSHPFATHKFKTGSKDILLAIGEETESRTLLNLVTNQLVFERFVSPYLREAIDYDELAKAWWPKGRDRAVVIDPARRFGQPIITQGVPTAILAEAHDAGRSVESIARWYEVDEQAVRDALDFENDLAA